MAILNKWLVGLVIYSGWGINILINHRDHFIERSKDILSSVTVACIVFLPWQIYIMLMFPKEAMAAYRFNEKHIFEALEGHSGDIWYHIVDSKTIYGGGLIPYILLIGVVLMYIRINNKNVKIGLLLIPFIVYGFFAYVKTKVSAHVFCVSILLFTAEGVVLDELFTRLGILKIPILAQKMVITICLTVIALFFINIGELQTKYTLYDNNPFKITNIMRTNKNSFISLKSKLPEGSVVFNVKGRHYIEFMFYTGIPAYNFIPTLDQYLDLKLKKRRIAIFNPVTLPDYLKTDADIVIIRRDFYQYDSM